MVFRIWRSTVSEYLESLVNFVRSVNISIIIRIIITIRIHRTAHG